MSSQFQQVSDKNILLSLSISCCWWMFLLKNIKFKFSGRGQRHSEGRYLGILFGLDRCVPGQTSWVTFRVGQWGIQFTGFLIQKEVEIFFQFSIHMIMTMPFHWFVHISMAHFIQTKQLCLAVWGIPLLAMCLRQEYPYPGVHVLECFWFKTVNSEFSKLAHPNKQSFQRRDYYSWHLWMKIDASKYLSKYVNYKEGR